MAHVLTFDYLGALGASLLFPILLVPKLGLVRVGDAVRHRQRGGGAVDHVPVSRAAAAARRGAARRRAPSCWLLLGGGMVGAEQISAAADDNLYADEVIFARNTRYQRIVLTKWKDDCGCS